MIAASSGLLITILVILAIIALVIFIVGGKDGTVRWRYFVAFLLRRCRWRCW